MFVMCLDSQTHGFVGVEHQENAVHVMVLSVAH